MSGRTAGDEHLAGMLGNPTPPSVQDLGRRFKHRFIACDPSENPRGPEAQEAIRRHVIQGLPKTKKIHDPNRIEIYLPPKFLLKIGPRPDRREYDLERR